LARLISAVLLLLLLLCWFSREQAEVQWGMDFLGNGCASSHTFLWEWISSRSGLGLRKCSGTVASRNRRGFLVLFADITSLFGHQ